MYTRTFLAVVTFTFLVARPAYAATGFGCNPVHWMVLSVLLLWGVYSLVKYIRSGVRVEYADGSLGTKRNARWVVSVFLSFILALFTYIYLPSVVQCPNDAGVSGWYVAYSDPQTGEYVYSNAFASKEACEQFEQQQLTMNGVSVMIKCFETADGIPETIRDTETFDRPGVATDTPITIEDLENIITDSEVRKPAARDTIPPIITIQGNNPAEVPVGGVYTDPGAIAVDETDGDVSASLTTTGLPVVTFIDSWFTITYTAVDASGNTAEAVRRVHVVDKGTSQLPEPDVPETPIVPLADEPPEIAVLGSNPSYVYVGATYSDAGVSAVDAEDGDLSDLVVVAGLPIDTSKAGSYTVRYSVMDTERYVTQASRIVHVVVPQLDTGMDLSYMQSCRDLETPIPECSVTDLNNDGYTTFADETIMLASAGRFEMTGDVKIERANTRTVQSCFLKIREGGSLSCAMNNHGTLQIHHDYLYENFGPKLDTAQMDEYGYVFDLGVLEAQMSGTIDDIMYYTIAQYDLNGDDIVDFEESLSNPDYTIHRDCLFEESMSASCEVADINDDGAVGDWDRYFVAITTGALLPSTFTVGELEAALFDRQQYTDAEVLAHCVANGTNQGNCVFADVNEDGEVNQLDMELFESETLRYDFNNDGVVDGTLNINL